WKVESNFALQPFGHLRCDWVAFRRLNTDNSAWRTKRRNVSLCYLRRRHKRSEEQSSFLLIRFRLGPKLNLLLKTGNPHGLLVGGSNDWNVIVGVFLRWDDVLVFNPRTLKDHGCLILLEQRQGLCGIERNEPLVKVSFRYPFF